MPGIAPTRSRRWRVVRAPRSRELPALDNTSGMQCQWLRGFVTAREETRPSLPRRSDTDEPTGVPRLHSEAGPSKHLRELGRSPSSLDHLERPFVDLARLDLPLRGVCRPSAANTTAPGRKAWCSDPSSLGSTSSGTCSRKKQARAPSQTRSGSHCQRSTTWNSTLAARRPRRARAIARTSGTASSAQSRSNPVNDPFGPVPRPGAEFDAITVERRLRQGILDHGEVGEPLRVQVRAAVIVPGTCVHVVVPRSPSTVVGDLVRADLSPDVGVGEIRRDLLAHPSSVAAWGRRHVAMLPFPRRGPPHGSSNRTADPLAVMIGIRTATARCRRIVSGARECRAVSGRSVENPVEERPDAHVLSSPAAA